MGSFLALGLDESTVPLPVDGESGVPFLDVLHSSALEAAVLEAAGLSSDSWSQADPFAASVLDAAAEVDKPWSDETDPLIGASAFAAVQEDLLAPGDALIGLALHATGSASADGAGNTLASARNIGTLTGTQTFRDWVGRTDLNDCYRFDLAQAGSLSMTLNGMSADADLQLLGAAGTLLASSANGGTQADAITRTLDAGTYYARVYRFSGNTNYNLTLTAAASTPTTSGFSSTDGYGEASVERAIERLLNVSIFDLPDQFGGGLYGLDRIGAPEVWNYGYTGQDVVVAVLDTGVDRNHQDLDANIWCNSREVAGNGVDDDGNGYVDDVYGWNFNGNNNDTLDVQGHGTHVAGTIAAENNGFGVTGVACNARIMAVKVLSDSGSGSYASVAEGIRYAANNGANVINLSLGGGTGDAGVQSAIDYAWNRGVGVIMAAGNDGAATTGYPAAYASNWGIAVGAVNSTGAMASFSNRAGSTVLDYVTAAGVSVTSTTPGNSYATYSGTSMATPHMAGAMALLLQANRASGRNLSIGLLEQLFTATATNAASASLALAGTSSAGGSGSSVQQLTAPGDTAADAAVPPVFAFADAVATTGSWRGSMRVASTVAATGSSDLSASIDPDPASAAADAIAAPVAWSAGSAVISIGVGSQDPLLSAWERSRGGDDRELDPLTGLLRRSAVGLRTS